MLKEFYARGVTPFAWRLAARGSAGGLSTEALFGEEEEVFEGDVLSEAMGGGEGTRYALPWDYTSNSRPGHFSAGGASPVGGRSAREGRRSAVNAGGQEVARGGSRTHRWTGDGEPGSR